MASLDRTPLFGNSPDMDTRLVRHLKRLRTARGLSQERLAAAARLSRGYLARLEIGLQDPTLGVLRRLAKALRVRVSDLVELSRGTIDRLRFPAPAPLRAARGGRVVRAIPRSERPGEGDALVRLIREADDLGFLSTHSLDDLLDLTDLWLERDALRATLMESYPAAAAFAVAFVPADRWVGEGSYVVAPIIYGTEKIPTVLCALPEEAIRELRALPPGAGRVAALFEIPRQYLDDEKSDRRRGQ